jgi:hypothetical protein
MALDKMVASIMAEADDQNANTAGLSVTVGGASAVRGKVTPVGSLWRLDVTVTRVREMPMAELAEWTRRGAGSNPVVTVGGVVQEKLPPLADVEVVQTGDRIPTEMGGKPGTKAGPGPGDMGDMEGKLISALARALAAAGVTGQDLEDACKCPSCTAKRRARSGGFGALHNPEGLTH